MNALLKSASLNSKEKIKSIYDTILFKDIKNLDDSAIKNGIEELKYMFRDRLTDNEMKFIYSIPNNTFYNIVDWVNYYKDCPITNIMDMAIYATLVNIPIGNVSSDSIKQTLLDVLHCYVISTNNSLVYTDYSKVYQSSSYADSMNEYYQEHNWETLSYLLEHYLMHDIRTLYNDIYGNDFSKEDVAHNTSVNVVNHVINICKCYEHNPIEIVDSRYNFYYNVVKDYFDEEGITGTMYNVIKDILTVALLELGKEISDDGTIVKLAYNYYFNVM